MQRYDSEGDSAATGSVSPELRFLYPTPGYCVSISMEKAYKTVCCKYMKRKKKAVRGMVAKIWGWKELSEAANRISQPTVA